MEDELQVRGNSILNWRGDGRARVVELLTAVRVGFTKRRSLWRLGDSDCHCDVVCSPVFFFNLTGWSGCIAMRNRSQKDV